MSSLPDEAKLDELYLPGTHESLALHFPLLSSICQSTSLTSQLRGGIRFLDLRFALLDDGTLWAYHGVVPQRRRAEDVFDEVYAWLEGEGARECVVVSCKQENPAPLFAPTLWSLLDRTSRWRSKWHDEDRWPALEEVRGKCVMFCRFGWDDRRGLHPPTWPNDSRAAWRTSIGGRDTVVQDWYGLSSPLALPRKASLALSLFDPSSSSLLPSPSPSPSDDQPPRLPHRISFLSCASFPLLYPSLAAKGFGLPSLGLGWRGVNDLVLRGLRRLALRDARLDGESGDETVKGDGRKGRGRRYEVGQGGMVLLLDFWECPAGGAGRNGRGGQEQRSSALVEELVRMNFA
ncbi:PLC-like phosphodiesterase [Rhodotorula diobovata]|uniref:PLC-like phosphodiesterase n=1 Tax=Rhodotorula diobovata TaxID=5288 RepID=A0A5C5FY49_9BASI|nr:PLC-like phosphodiesterase [Rhodotorula diobovata]